MMLSEAMRGGMWSGMRNFYVELRFRVPRLMQVNIYSKSRSGDYGRLKLSVCLPLTALRLSECVSTCVAGDVR
jgi:hypothetical protein